MNACSIVLIALWAVFVAADPAFASVVVYTDLTSWQTAVTGSTVVTEAFNGPGLNAPGLSVTSSAGLISTGLWSDRVVQGGDSTTWSFVGGAFGFGANWDLTPGGAGQGTEFTLNLAGGGTLPVGTEVPNSYSGQFFGFVSTDPFLSVFYDGGTQLGSAETYTLDNLVFAQTPETSQIPEPSTFALMGLAMAALCFAALRRRTGCRA